MIRNAVTALSPAVLRVMYFYLDVFTLKQIQYDDTVAAMGVYSTWLRDISLPESLRLLFLAKKVYLASNTLGSLRKPTLMKLFRLSTLKLYRGKSSSF